MLDLSIVIVGFNTKNEIRDCLQSIYKNTVGISFEVIVSDNNSTDGTHEMLATEFPSVKLIKNGKNIGFAAANNRGFEISSGRYLLALNPDTIVLGDALGQLVRFMDSHPEAGACGCKLLNADGSLQPSWENFPTIASEIFYGTPLNRVFGHDKRIDRGSFYEVDWVRGACLIVRRETMNKVGMFDDDLFAPIYSEETDWCYRMKRAGWKVYYCPRPSVVHVWGRATERKPVWSFLQLHRAKILFFQKHHGQTYAEIFRLLRIATCVLRILATQLALALGNGLREELTLLLERQKKLFIFLAGTRLCHLKGISGLARIDNLCQQASFCECRELSKNQLQRFSVKRKR